MIYNRIYGGTCAWCRMAANPAPASRVAPHVCFLPLSKSIRVTAPDNLPHTVHNPYGTQLQLVCGRLSQSILRRRRCWPSSSNPWVRRYQRVLSERQRLNLFGLMFTGRYQNSGASRKRHKKWFCIFLPFSDFLSNFRDLVQ